MSHPMPTTMQAVLNAVLVGLAPLLAVPPMTLSVWANEYFFLSAEASHTQGRWQAYPFQRGWMDAFSNDDIEEVTVRKAKRVGYTKTLLAMIAYTATHRRRKQALWQPTDDDRDSFVKSEIDPMLRDVAAMRPVLVGGKEDTMKLKSFLGSVLHILGGKAARAYRRITVAVAMLDEADGFDQKIEKSSDPITLARGRLEGAPFPKLIAGSTPRVKGLSHIEYREDHADARMRYYIVCPHCQAEHPLQWGGSKVSHGFKWDGADPATVRHVCPHCDGHITQADYLKIWDAGAGWVSTCGRYRYDHHRSQWFDETLTPITPPRHIAFHVWTAYSPQRAWTDIVREFLEAKTKAKTGETGPLEGFVNETLGELWEETVEKADEHALSRRAEDYRRFTVPFGGLVLVSGVDVQDNRFEVTTWAIGRGEEMWAIDYSVIPANPADEREWDKLDKFRETIFTHHSGQAMRIEAAAIDTGGHFTHQCYNYCRQRERQRVFAVRGDPQPSKVVKGKATIQDVNWRGQVLKRGVRLWYVGTDTAKDLIYGRLCVTQPGAGFVHFSKDLPPDFYTQLTAESRIPQRTARGIEYKWVNTKRARNEVLDCTVYAIFCTHMLNLHVYTDAMWTKLEQAVQPENGDLFAIKAPAANASINPIIQQSDRKEMVNPVLNRRPRQSFTPAKTW
jgi:phage terminase large subunit GpA-like protein